MNTDINKQDTALLVMDMQNITVTMLKDCEAIIKSINKAIHHAKSNNMRVIYVVIGFRKGYPDASHQSKSLFKSNPAMTLDTEESVKVHASVSKEPGDIVVIKKRVSAFTGSDLEVVLRSLGCLLYTSPSPRDRQKS